MINNPYDLSDEEIWGKEPTWEEQEIERLKKKIEELECKLEDKECCIEMAIEYIVKNKVFFATREKVGSYITNMPTEDLLNILEGKNENN